MTDPELWKRLCRFEFDAVGVKEPFSERLRKKHGWSRCRASLAIDEYRRFLYLAATGTAVVVPSKVVDEVWHFHLTYTRSYWDGLCETVLRKRLHHSPGTGSSEETEAFRALYVQTLMRYEEEFAAPAPVRFWPMPELVSRRNWNWGTFMQRPRLAVAAGLVLAVLFFVFGTGEEQSDGALAADVGAYVFIGIVALVFLVSIFKSKGGGGGHGGSGCGSGSDCGSSCGGGCGGD